MLLAEEQAAVETEMIAGLQWQFAAVAGETLQMEDRLTVRVDLHDEFGGQDHVVAGVALPKKQPVPRGEGEECGQ